ncbi:magnesium/cobalt transporter CorA [Pedobacter sp. SAFR-022]|uniref:magnesium/cobalt transporter CorA n=1 Tax=Pedobacter sp. SAFR-022 TaxID=3436861 RepID=UPI003F805A74
MSKRHKKLEVNQRCQPDTGSSPGAIYLDERSLEPRITLHNISAASYSTQVIPSLSEVLPLVNDTDKIIWIDIKGFKSIPMFELLQQEFGINKLTLEDITRTHERPKFEEFANYAFATSRMLIFNAERELENTQVSFILIGNALITFQENYEDCIQPVRERLKAGKGNIRIGGASYIMYAIMDVVIDTYIEILGSWADELDTLEDRLMEKPERSIMYDTQMIKRHLISIRRVAWPEKDKLNDIIRSDSPFIQDQTKLFIKDAYDHCIQAIDLIDSLKEISISNIDMYLSMISIRMNEIMKVLTIISSIFIPLTFIAGIYGMNFARQDPITGKTMPMNMPELYAPYGYLYAVALMILIAVVQLIYFKKKGWFK